MTKRTIIFLAAIFTTACLQAQPVRVATYNVRNYCLTDRLVDGIWRKDYPKPEEEKVALREVIKDVNPDILAFQEMGGKEYLIELQKDLKSEGVDYLYSAVMNGVDEVRKTAVLSSIPIQKVIEHSSFHKGKVLRGLLEVVFEGEKGPWSLYVVHLKSRRNPNPEDFEARKERQHEVENIKKKIKHNDKVFFLVVGDFNDGPRSLAIKKLLRDKKDKSFVHLLPAEDQNGEVWTYSSKSWGEYSQFDYIMSSPRMLASVKEERAFIADAPSSEMASDHRMVYADLDI